MWRTVKYKMSQNHKTHFFNQIISAAAYAKRVSNEDGGRVSELLRQFMYSYFHKKR